ncbi:craniofacial development protein 2-like protein [Plakobranchus ocellatus]|uniref:Craniofacial development protein 2-like protein n=1 Tax=Plakobranchus ocellatus TaxID=259542 RepID=A0AAV4D7I5_9GAST|nr:craniofacial development protein 2-like protein [Plakobranchus ocellatus]
MSQNHTETLVNNIKGVCDSNPNPSFGRDRHVQQVAPGRHPASARKINTIKHKNIIVEYRTVVAKLADTTLNLGIIQSVAPASESEDVEVEKFYEEIEKAKGHLKSQDIIIVLEDFNAKLEMKE